MLTPGGVVGGFSSLAESLIRGKAAERNAMLQQQQQEAAAAQRGIENQRADKTLAAQLTQHEAANKLGGDTLAEQIRHNTATEENSVANAQGHVKDTDAAYEQALMQAAGHYADTLATAQDIYGKPAHTPDSIHQQVSDFIRNMRAQKAPKAAPAGPAAPLPQMGDAPPAPPAGAPTGMGAAPAPANKAQMRLVNMAQSWKSLPSLSESDKQKVQQAVDARDYNALAKMAQRMQGVAAVPGNQ